MPFYPFVGEGAPTKIDYRKKVGYPYSKLSTGKGSKSILGVLPSQDKDSKFRLILVESRIHRLARRVAHVGMDAFFLFFGGRLWGAKHV